MQNEFNLKSLINFVDYQPNCKQKQLVKKFGFDNMITFNLDYASLFIIYQLCETPQLKLHCKFMIDNYFDDLLQLEENVETLFKLIRLEDENTQFKIIQYFKCTLKLFNRYAIFDRDYHKLTLNHKLANTTKTLKYFDKLAYLTLKYKDTTGKEIIFDFLQRHFNFFWW